MSNIKSWQKEEFEYLDSIGIKWREEKDFESDWQEKLLNLKNFVSKNKKLPASGSSNKEECIIGNWCTSQRQSYNGIRYRILTKKQISQLESIPGWFWDTSEKWMKKYLEMSSFVKANNRLPNFRSSNKQEAMIGRWNNRQILKKRRNTLKEEYIHKLELIHGWKWDLDLDDIWDNKYQELCKFIEKYKRLPKCSLKKEKKEISLVNWISDQRKSKKGEGRGRYISQEQIYKLESIPFWFWDKDLDELWQDNANKLKLFVNKYNKLPNFRSQDSEEKKIGNWANTQRQNYKSNGQRILTKEQIIFLESIPGWKWKKDLDQLWQENFSSVKEFQEKNNRLPFHHSKNKEEKRLYQWISVQKSNYKGKAKDRRILTPDQISFLESIPGWKWDLDLSKKWEESFQELKKWTEYNKKLANASSLDSKEKRLGVWGQSQRKKYKGIDDGTLTKEQISKLESIPGWTWGLLDKWIKKFNEFDLFFKENKIFPSCHSSNLSERSLGKWGLRQKSNYKIKLLNSEQIIYLQSIPGWKWSG